MKVLIVEDEQKTRDYLERGLTEEGWVADTAATGLDGLYRAQSGIYDAIILDVMLPELDGFAVLQRLREEIATPVIMLTARDRVDDRVRGLRGGANDYLVKPFSFQELLARLDVLTRHHPAHPEAIVQVADLHIDFIGRRVRRGERRIALTVKEFALLEVLVRRRGRVVSKTAIAELVWDVSFDTNTNVVEVAVKRLRAKLEHTGEEARPHGTRHGIRARATRRARQRMTGARSIAVRLALMFGVATALVTSVASAGLFVQQAAEFDRHSTEELRGRYMFVERMAAFNDNEEGWRRLTAKFADFSSTAPGLQFILDSNDPAYRFPPTPEQAVFARVADGRDRIDVNERSYSTYAGVVPAKGRRPTVRLILAYDRAPLHAAQRALASAIAITALLAIVTTTLLGWWLACRGLAPADRISAHARELGQGDMTLRLPTADLPSELTGLVIALNDALDRLHSSHQRLSDFNADVAHELRTPLTNLIGETELALSRARPVEELAGVLRSNLEDLGRLRSIINDMLFLARADAGEVQGERTLVDLRGECERSVAFMEVLFEECGASVCIEGNAVCLADRALFGRAMANLLDNALAHGQAGGPVRIVIEPKTSAVGITVINAGQPVSAKALPRIFDRFFCADPARRSDGATHGLGLAIVKAIAAAHGGSVYAGNVEGGVAVGFTLAAEDAATVDKP